MTLTEHLEQIFSKAPDLVEATLAGTVDQLEFSGCLTHAGVQVLARLDRPDPEPGELVGALVDLGFQDLTDVLVRRSEGGAQLRIDTLEEGTFRASSEDGSVIQFSHSRGWVNGYTEHREGREATLRKSLFTYRTLYEACANELLGAGMRLTATLARGPSGGPEGVWWHALSDDLTLRGDTPVELLGLRARFGSLSAVLVAP